MRNSRIGAGEIVSGTVRRFDRSDVILDLGKFEAMIPATRERVVVRGVQRWRQYCVRMS